MKSKFATFVSYIFPFLLVITLIIAINNIIELIMLAVVPCIIWLISAKLSGQNWDIEDRNHRLIPLIILTIYGVVISFIFNDLFSKAFLINIIFILIITLFWKISMHCYGLSTLIMLLMYLLKYTNNNYYLIISLIISYSVFLILTIWSRLYLKKHTVLQVVIGTFSGFLVNLIMLKFV
ncbi:phosphoesterase PA-phosphatase [Methanothermococcus okinawensis]|nr:phosphoesterase PA-phosphatase [Methanothermococcus okinawensis]